MSSAPEPNVDLVAVACVVESSLVLASEWSRILIEYVYPLLKRLSELHPSHQFRLAFVTYGAADTRPHPLLSKRFFAPLSQVTKVLREEPSKLGIGQTSSGSGRGLSALEGLVAAIEFFDMLMMASANFPATQSPQKDSRSFIFHLLHIAASPPDNAQKPHHNIMQHLDSVNWDTIPAELRKRKINLSLIGLRKIPQFQDLQSLVAGSGAQSPWFNVHAPHVLLLAGFPAPQTPHKSGTKRQTDTLTSDHSPDAKRQKLAADPITKATSASPAISSARIPQNQRAQPPPQPVSSQVPRPPSTTASGQNSSPVAQPVLAVPSVPASATASPSVPPPPSGPSITPKDREILEQVVAQTGFTFGQMMDRLKALEREIANLDTCITNPQNAGQTVAVDAFKKDRAAKTHVKEQIKMLLREHYHRTLLAKEAQKAQAGSSAPAPPNGSAEAGPSAQPHPPNVPNTLTEQPTGPSLEEHKPTVSDSQVLAQFWQSRGGTISAGGNPQEAFGQTQSHQSVSAETATQKAVEKKGIPPQSFGPPLQAPAPPLQEAVAHPVATNNQLVQAFNNSTWYGTFSETFTTLVGQVKHETQVHVVGMFSTPTQGDFRLDIRTDTWPKNLNLNSCKEPLKDSAELSSWLKRHQPRSRVMRFKPNPRAPDGPLNEQRFFALYKFMSDHRIFAYAGWQLPSGQFLYNFFIFPMQNSFVGAMFPDGLPDLPGSGNTLDVRPTVAETRPQMSSGSPFPPALLARMQGLEPAKQKQLLQFIRIQEQLRRQQLQQSQQPLASGQPLNPLGMSVPPNPYGAAANLPAGLHANVNVPPTNAPTYNMGGGTVNYEMLQSFMQRNADGSTSQGMKLGPMP